MSNFTGYHFEPWGFLLQPCKNVNDCYVTATGNASTAMICRAFRNLDHKICICNNTFGMGGKGCLHASSQVKNVTLVVGLFPSLYALFHLARALRLFVRGTAPRQYSAGWFALICSVFGLITTQLWIWLRFLTISSTTPVTYDLFNRANSVIGIGLSLFFQLSANSIVAVAWLRVMQSQYEGNQRELNPNVFTVVYTIGVTMYLVLFFIGNISQNYATASLFGLLLMTSTAISIKFIGRQVKCLLSEIIEIEQKRIELIKTPGRKFSIISDMQHIKLHKTLQRCLMASRSMSNRMFCTAFFIAANAFVPSIFPLATTDLHPANFLFVTNTFTIACTIASVLNYIVATCESGVATFKHTSVTHHTGTSQHLFCETEFSQADQVMAQRIAVGS